MPAEQADSRVPFFLTGVLLVIQVLGLLLSVVLGLLLVDEVQALRLEELVDLGAGKADEHFLGHFVLDGLAWIRSVSLRCGLTHTHTRVRPRHTR